MYMSPIRAAADGAIEWDVVVSPYHLEKSLLTVELVERRKERGRANKTIDFAVEGRWRRTADEPMPATDHFVLQIATLNDAGRVSQRCESKLPLLELWKWEGR